MTNTTNTTAAKHYAKRDPEAQGTHYENHVYAMTTEGLHAKSAIAAEPAHRDIEIERLRAALAAPAQAAALVTPSDDGFMAAVNEMDGLYAAPQPAAPAQAGEYPELPIRYATYDAWGNQTKHGYNAKDMHAYVDADRAARVVAQAAPVEAENEIDLLAEAALCERLDACLAAARAAQGAKHD